MNSSSTNISFNNKIKDTKESNILLYANFYGGAGIGVGDFNNDGLQDLYFAGNLVDDKLYFKPEYMDKQSKSVKYLKLDYRLNYLGATWGFTTRSTDDELNLYETFASVGLSKKKKYKDDKVEVEITFDGYMPPDEAGDNTTFEYEDKFKISWKLTDKVRLYNLGEVSKLKGNLYYKGKIGIEVLL